MSAEESKVTITSSKTIERFGRMDAKFMALSEKHLPLIDELLNKFTHEELLALAKRLPFDEYAACAINQTATFCFSDRNPKRFFEWLGRQKRATNTAVYVAAAAQYTIAKILEEMVEIAKRKLAAITEMHALLKLSKDKEAPLLFAALKRGGEEKLKETDDGGGDAGTPAQSEAHREAAPEAARGDGEGT